MTTSPEPHYVQLEGIKVAFPYKPYKIQENYMRQVILCAQQVIVTTTVYILLLLLNSFFKY